MTHVNTYNNTDPMAHNASQIPSWTLADRLRKIRRDRHLTQDQMAREIGVKAVTWAAWEAGRTRPQDVVELAELIEARFGVPAAWTLGVLAPPVPEPRKASGNGTVAWGRRRFDHLVTAAAVL